MNSSPQLEIRRIGFFGIAIRILFGTFNLFMLAWLIAAWTLVSELKPQSHAEQIEHNIGAAIGTGVILFTWMAGAVILGLPAMIYRGEKLIVALDSPEATTYQKRKWLVRGSLMVIALILFFAVLGANKTRAQPYFAVEQWCHQVASSGGTRSEYIYTSCIRQEQTAYDTLKRRWFDLTHAVRDWCTQVAKSGNAGSYLILNSCIDQELAATRDPNRQFRR
ncbi:MAG TPA: hypothetical protein VNL39_13315 [Xanthobacteraceae bacterium]|nr:hypothetical protein [Xanthobacteraceae bacterium]